MVVLAHLLLTIIILPFIHNLDIYLYMDGIRFRIARCDTLNDDFHILKKVICFSVERDDNVGEQISHCIQLTGSQCIGKSTEECVDLAFSLMSGSIATSANKLLSSNTSVLNSYYIPNI